MSQTIEDEIEFYKQKIQELKSKRVCSYCGSTQYYAKGLCKTCYARYRANGTPEKKERRKKYLSAEKSSTKTQIGN